MVKNIFILILLTFLVIFIYQVFFNHPPLDTVSLKIKNKTYNLEVAQTIPQQGLGLMNRSSLCSNCGMIFVFDLELPRSFWMKNTLIPLDMIFLSANGQVINIENAIPQTGIPDSQLKLYSSTSPTKYVIELNALDSQKLSLQPGDIIDLSAI